MPTISYVLPVHDNASTIEGVVGRIVERLSQHAGSQVVLVENGSTDDSAAVTERLAATVSTSLVTVLADRSASGIGNAWRTGIPMTTGELVVLTASDLPFGFTDLDGALGIEPRPALVIGSKAHPESMLHVGGARRLLSRVFRVARGLLLGLWQGDTQGSLLVGGALVRDLAPELRSPDYLIATEIVALCARAGVRPVEVPVDYPPQEQPSTVRPVRDSLSMLAGLVRLRRRLRHGPASTRLRNHAAP